MNPNNIYRLKLRALRDEFAERAKHDNRRAKLIENAERMEAEAELKRVSLTRNGTVVRKQPKSWPSEI